MCLHGVKAQEGAVLGGVGPARRGRAGQRRGGRGPGWGSAEIAGLDRNGRPDGLRATAPRHRALRGGGAGPPRGPRLFSEKEKVARSPAVPARCLVGQGSAAGRGRCAGRGQVRGAAGRCAPGEAAAERGWGVPVPGEPGRRGQHREAARGQCPRAVREGAGGAAEAGWSSPRGQRRVLVVVPRPRKSRYAGY